MPDEKMPPVGLPVAGTGLSANGNHAQTNYTTDLASGIEGDLRALCDASRVEPADLPTAAKVQEVINLVATWQGIVRQAGLEALTRLIGALPAEERQRLNLYSGDLFVTGKQVEGFLSQCPPPPGAPKFKPMSLAELRAMPAKQWQIDQVIGAGDLGMLYGAPGMGKTFVVIDLALSACTGRQWAMRFDVVKPLTVAYCAGEGVSGLPQRFDAACEHYGIDDLPNFHFYAAAPQLFTADAGEYTEASIGDFVREWQERQAAGAAGQLDLLIVDTLHSASTGADENSAQDMGRVLRGVKAATSALGCAVLLVHHSNKAGTGERGSSAMRGAMDVMIEARSSAGKFSLNCEKLKDGQQWKPQTFDLVAAGESVRVWWDAPADAPGVGQKAADKERLLRELQRYADKRFTSKALAEVLGKSDNYTRNLLAEIERAGDCKRSLRDESKGQAPANPWVYFAVETIASAAAQHGL